MDRQIELERIIRFRSAGHGVIEEDLRLHDRPRVGRRGEKRGRLIDGVGRRRRDRERRRVVELVAETGRSGGKARNPSWPKVMFRATPCSITSCGDDSKLAKSPRGRRKDSVDVNCALTMSYAAVRGAFQDGHK